MSSGSSSHERACFSVDRTKYLMLSKLILDRSAPHVGNGFLVNSRSAFRRRSSIHSGSFFFAEMSRTTSSSRPRRAEAPATSGSAQPYSQVPSPSSPGWAVDVIYAEPPGRDVLFVVVCPCLAGYGPRRSGSRCHEG